MPTIDYYPLIHRALVALEGNTGLSARTTFVVSYYAPNGNYAADTNAFATSGVDNPPLHALANGVDGSNGLYLYASGGGFPTSTFSSANYWVDVVFTPGTTYSVSGTITGTSGATIALSGATAATATADASGNYSFTGLSNGSYTLTPSKAGFTFSPTNTPVTLSGANVTGVNFTATASPTWSISGTITGGGGATATLSGAANATVTADGSGNYSFSGLANGNYTVTPAKAGYTMSPINAAAVISGANGANHPGSIRLEGGNHPGRFRRELRRRSLRDAVAKLRLAR